MSAPTFAPTRAPTSPTFAPTRVPTVSIASIQQEGNAMADIARAIPGLTTLSGMDRYILRVKSTCD